MNGTAQNSQLPFRALTVLLWAALPANALLYAISWDQLPRTLATHFNFANQPNGWMSREGSFAFAVFFAMLLAVTATVILLRVRKPDTAAWGLLVLFYVAEGTLLWAENATISFNLHGTPLKAAPILSVGITAAILLVVLALVTRRGRALPAGTVLANETHASAVFGIVLGLPAIAFAFLIAEVPIAGLKIALGVGMILLAFGAAMAASGFHYIFTPAGLEIRTLGFRVRSIPAHAIESYAADSWSGLGGYGIRGVGEWRAYVWGNRGVTIKTLEGTVFLGHDYPAKIVHDLDLLKQREPMQRAKSNGF
jgi:hypothetical protein